MNCSRSPEGIDLRSEASVTDVAKSGAGDAVDDQAEAMLVLEERWSDLSPQEGTELCVCSWCGQMIGPDEVDPIWEDRIEYCTGCEICEIAARMWKPHPDHTAKMLELRFHNKCLNEIVEDLRPAG